MNANGSARASAQWVIAAGSVVVSPLFSQFPKSVSPPLSLPGYPSEDPFSNAAVMPLSVNMNMVLSAYMIPSPLPGAGRTDNDCEAESDIPFVTFPLLRRRNDCTCLKVNWPGVLALRRYITQENCTREESRILIKQN